MLENRTAEAMQERFRQLVEKTKKKGFFLGVTKKTGSDVLAITRKEPDGGIQKALILIPSEWGKRELDNGMTEPVEVFFLPKEATEMQVFQPPEVGQLSNLFIAIRNLFNVIENQLL